MELGHFSALLHLYSPALLRDALCPGFNTRLARAALRFRVPLTKDRDVAHGEHRGLPGGTGSIPVISTKREDSSVG